MDTLPGRVSSRLFRKTKRERASVGAIPQGLLVCGNTLLCTKDGSRLILNEREGGNESTVLWKRNIPGFAGASV
jgi:hypothetical protein